MFNRLAILTLAVVLLVTLLVSCGGSKKTTLTVGNINAGTENQISADNLGKIAQMLASVYSAEYDTQEMLIAASRGYDMTAQGFNDAAVDPTVDQGVSLEAVKNLFNQANEKASADVKVDPAIYESVSEADVNTLIKCFQTTVNTEDTGNIFDMIMLGIGMVVGWITNTLCFGSYLAGICVFAVIIEILMLPFAIKQQKNSIKQAKLRPKEMAIRNKYKGRTDQATMQKMQQEIQEFYQRENFSPYSGCLPLLIQMPILIALYNIVMDPLHYVLGQSAGMASALTTYATTARAAGGAGMALSGNGGTISILSAITEGSVKLEGLREFAFFSNGSAIFDSLAGIVDKIPRFTVGGVNFGLNPSFENFNILLLVPVLTFGAYFLTSKLNRRFMYQPTTNEGADARQVACSNTMMDITMPAMSTFFTFIVPALVGVYWIFRSFVSLLKQFIVSRLMPLPTFTEEDYKAAEREMKGKHREVKKSANAGKVRSLHHIDDEDFEDTREQALARKAAIEEREREEQAKKAAKTPFGAAPLKEERKKAKQAEESTEESPAENDTENNAQE